jgi:hypothetical protein
MNSHIGREKNAPPQWTGQRRYFFFSFLGRFFSRFFGEPVPFISTSY